MLKIGITAPFGTFAFRVSSMLPFSQNHVLICPSGSFAGFFTRMPVFRNCHSHTQSAFLRNSTSRLFPAQKELWSKSVVIGMLQAPPLTQSRSQSTSLVGCPALHKHLQPSAGSCKPFDSGTDCCMHTHKTCQTQQSPHLRNGEM